MAEPDDRIDYSRGDADRQHPFLTPKRLRLQKLGRKDEFEVPMGMPEFFRGDPAPVDPFDFTADRDKKIHNVRASTAFPRVESLAESPLTSYRFQYANVVARPRVSSGVRLLRETTETDVPRHELLFIARIFDESGDQFGCCHLLCRSQYRRHRQCEHPNANG